MIRKIAIATTTRADWGLLSPLASALRQKGIDVQILAGNMHLMPEYGMTVNEIIADGFTPAARIPAEGSPAHVASATLEGYAEALGKLSPEALIILGDRYEMLSVAMAATIKGIPLVHIAGGTISEGAIDDNIRHALTKLSTLHLVETDSCRRRVIQMGEEPRRVITTGAIGVHNILSVAPMSKEELEESIGFRFPRRTILVTLHAATNDSASPLSRMQSLISALEEKKDLGVIFTYPNNDVDPASQIQLIEEFCNRNNKAIAIPSLGRIRYLSALRYVDAVAGNSSSGLVEVPSMGIPTLDIGIRQQGRERGESVIHCEADAESISKGIDRLFTPEVKAIAEKKGSPYYKPDTLRLMTDSILSFPFEKNHRKKFYDISHPQ